MENRVLTQEHILSTYMQIRLLVGGFLIFGPILIILAGTLNGIPMLAALSEYFHIEWNNRGTPGTLRTMFVCLLTIIGILMIAYRGFDTTDNWVHNLGGVGSIGVAFFPMSCMGLNYHEGFVCHEGWFPKLHMPSVVLMFLMAAASAYYIGGPKLKSALSIELHRRLRRRSIFALGLMAVGLASYGAFHFYRIGSNKTLMLLELSGFIGFGWHWISMSWIIHQANKTSASSHATTSANWAGTSKNFLPKPESSLPQIIP